MAAGTSSRRGNSYWAPTPEPQAPRRTSDFGLRLVEWFLSGLVVLVLVVLVGLPAWTQAADTAPALTISPASGTAGTLVTVSGSNFGHATVQLTWDGSATGMPSVNATGNGSFRATFTVPVSAGGTHEVRAGANTTTTASVTGTGNGNGNGGNKRAPTTATASAMFVLGTTTAATEAPSPTTTATATPSPTATRTASTSPAPTATPAPSATAAPNPTATQTASPVPTASPAPTAAPTATPQATSTPLLNSWSVPFLGRTPSGQVVINGQKNVTISGLQFQNLTVVAIVVSNSSNVTVTANDFDNVVGGILVIDSTNVTVTWNRFRNIGDGTVGSGHSNYVQFARTTDGYIGHNKGIGGNTEDMISMYQSGGSSSSSPIVIEYNQFEGTNWASPSGTGINMGDSGGSHMIARFNTLLSPAQVGIAVSSGTDNHITDNIIYGAQRPFSNVGISVWNQITSVTCSGIEVSRNKVKWYRYDGVQNPAWSAGNCGPILGWTSGTNTNDWFAPLDPNTMHVVL
jgi:hypothetical protein